MLLGKPQHFQQLKFNPGHKGPKKVSIKILFLSTTQKSKANMMKGKLLSKSFLPSNEKNKKYFDQKFPGMLSQYFSPTKKKEEEIFSEN